MIHSDSVLDPALQELKIVKILQINKYKADFTEFSVAWVIFPSLWIVRNLQKLKIMQIVRILTILPLGIQNLEKWARSA